MTTISANTDALLDDARQLVTHLEEGNEDGIQELLDRMVDHKESRLFQDLGKLTRNLHEALNNIQMDPELAKLVEKDMPNCRERLNYVIDVTDKAAHRTLNVVEEILPLSKELADHSDSLHKAWSRFLTRQMQPEEFRSLSKEMEKFLGLVADSSARVSAGLSDVLVAQDYQDITGQIIRQVIGPVQEVEDRLVNLVRMTGQRLAPKNGNGKPVPKLDGPQIPGRETPTAVRGQDEVDELLSSLGF